jgi:hypothetical protein
MPCGHEASHTTLVWGLPSRVAGRADGGSQGNGKCFIYGCYIEGVAKEYEETAERWNAPESQLEILPVDKSPKIKPLTIRQPAPGTLILLQFVVVDSSTTVTCVLGTS